MAIFQKSKTTCYAKMQAALGSPATIAGTDAIDPLMDSAFVQPKTNMIDRGLIRNSRWPQKLAVGGRWGEGSLALELRGSGTAGTAPELGPLFQSLLGSVVTNAAGTVADIAASTTEFDSALALTVGQLIRVEIGTGWEVRRVATKTGAGPFTYTVDRAFSQAPADGADIAAGVSYFHAGTETPSYFTLHQYLDGLKLTCNDTVCEALSVTTTEKEVIKGDFTLRSKSCAESAATDALTQTLDNQDPLIGTDCNLLVDGAALNMKSMELSLTTRRSRAGINDSGIGELPFLAKFEATAKLTPWVEDAAQITALFAATTIDIEMLKGTTAGNILAIHAYDLQRTDATIGDDEGDFAWDVPLTITGGVVIGFF